MKIKDVVVYISGYDYLVERMQAEKDLIARKIERSDLPPPKAELRTMGTVYSRRLVTMFTYPAVLASRVTGVDLAARGIKNILSSKSSSR